MYGSLKLIGT